MFLISLAVNKVLKVSKMAPTYSDFFFLPCSLRMLHTPPPLPVNICYISTAHVEFNEFISIRYLYVIEYRASPHQIVIVNKSKGVQNDFSSPSEHSFLGGNALHIINKIDL